MQTSKDLAFKSFCDGFKMKAYWKNYRAKLSDNKNEDEQIKEFLQDHFEHWWSTWYNGNEHRECFQSRQSVFIDGKRYISAE